jgi:hypothetical protein
MKTREIGIFTCGDCDGEGGWYEPHFFDGTPWVECLSCNGRADSQATIPYTGGLNFGPPSLSPNRKRIPPLRVLSP